MAKQQRARLRPPERASQRPRLAVQANDLSEAPSQSSASLWHGGGTRLPSAQRQAAVASLERTIGNQQVQRLLAHRFPHSNRTGATQSIIQRTIHDNPAEFIPWLQGRLEYTSRISNNEGACAPAAQSIGAFLAAQGFAVRYRRILAFPNQAGAGNRNHYVVVVNIGGANIVVDPTQGQFQGGAAQVALENDWIDRMGTVKLRVAVGGTVHAPIFAHRKYRMKYQDFAAYPAATAYGGQGGIAYDAAAGTVLPQAVGCVLL